MPRPNALYERWYPSVACRHKPGQTYTKYPCVCGRELWPPRGRGRGESLHSPRRIVAKLNAVEAYKLHLAGWTYQQIAARLGYQTRQGAWRAVRRTLDAVTAQRNWEEQSRQYGGRPRREITQADLDAVLASYAADDRIAADRLETMQEQLVALVASQARRVTSKV
jgi:hypothetical protein